MPYADASKGSSPVLQVILKLSSTSPVQNSLFLVSDTQAGGGATYLAGINDCFQL